MRATRHLARRVARSRRVHASSCAARDSLLRVFSPVPIFAQVARYSCGLVRDTRGSETRRTHTEGTAWVLPETGCRPGHHHPPRSHRPSRLSPPPPLTPRRSARWPLATPHSNDSTPSTRTRHARRGQYARYCAHWQGVMRSTRRQGSEYVARRLQAPDRHDGKEFADCRLGRLTAELSRGERLSLLQHERRHVGTASHDVTDSP
jgi:hypothetical protein